MRCVFYFDDTSEHDDKKRTYENGDRRTKKNCVAASPLNFCLFTCLAFFIVFVF